jgi:transcriptional regulator with XRE-family HTH domain
MMNADKFRAIRLYLKMTQSEFADLLGVSIATVGRIESGSLDVTPRVRARIVSKINLDDKFYSFYEKFQKLSQ